MRRLREIFLGDFLSLVWYHLLRIFFMGTGCRYFEGGPDVLGIIFNKII